MATTPQQAPSRQPMVDANGMISGEWLLWITTAIGAAGIGGQIASPIDISGNADTASRLKTPRLINGVPFDGSADITVLPSTLETPTSAVSGAIWLGGSRVASVPMGSPPAWAAVVNYVPFYASASMLARVRVELFARTAGVGAKARLWNVTDGVSAGESAIVGAIVATAAPPFDVVVAAGKVYRLDLISNTNLESVYAIGQLYPV